MARLVTAGTSTKLRQAAAHAIEEPEVLRQLIRDVRGGNDKSVYKVLTAKRDALIEQARQREQLKAEIDSAAITLERHSQGPYDSSYSPLLTQFETRWEALAAQAEPELRERVQQWRDRARQTIAEHSRQVAAEAARAEAAAHAAAEARRLSEQQAQAAAEAAAEQAQALQEQRKALTERQDAEQLAVRDLGALIRKARAALSDGGTARAAGIRQVIETKLAGAPPLPAAVASQLQQLDQQLGQLKDWKSFSVTPKRAELIEEMTFLVDASLDPLALAERIKSLQDEWRTLSKGAGEEFKADEQRFQEATQKAYQPCRDFFAAQALVREDNLRRRNALLAQLTAFETETNWEQADWQAVIKVLRETKQEWRRHLPVDRQLGKQQDESFAAITASLQGRIDAEHTCNVKQKESLIERAQALLASEDGRKAIDEIKGLQQTWRAVGPVPREVDQRLWGDFRQHCDAVFQKRDQESAAHAAGLENNKAQAMALCEQIEKIATLEGAELLASLGTQGELRTAFEALGEFPRADTRELRNRFDQGLARCKAAHSRQQARDAERAWCDLFEAADHIRAYRLAAARRVDTEPLDALKAAAETYIASVQRWPKSGLEALKQALAADHAADLVANEQALRLLCIRAEILTDLPTPPPDQPLRREHQLQRLVQGMGQRLQADETPLDTMAIDWIRVGPVDELAYEPLLQRFRRCRERGIARADGRF
ncbi:MAG: DUF349 domain-containing protein [Pseudomonadota bacterium]